MLSCLGKSVPRGEDPRVPRHQALSGPGMSKGAKRPVWLGEVKLQQEGGVENEVRELTGLMVPGTSTLIFIPRKSLSLSSFSLVPHFSWSSHLLGTWMSSLPVGSSQSCSTLEADCSSFLLHA